MKRMRMKRNLRKMKPPKRHAGYDFLFLVASVGVRSNSNSPIGNHLSCHQILLGYLFNDKDQFVDHSTHLL